MGRHNLVSMTPCRLTPTGPVVDVAHIEIDGVSVAAVLPTIPEDASPAVREGVARRRLVMTTGVCPCGARMLLPSVAVEHEVDCPAVDATLAAALGLG